MAALVFVSWLLLRRRSRAGVVATGIFSVLYFGFWKKGCICSIGSIQNIAQALSDSSFGVPLAVLFFGFTPLIFALFFGRVFCAAVCPHGALQDLVLLKPVKVPAWLDHSLRMLAWIYLGLAVVFAATGGGFIICQYDPFVPIFRLSGSLTMVLLGVVCWCLGIFVGRPFCRFLCPYGVLLGLASSVSKWRVRITPDTCTQCRLCEESCPFGAIEKSTVEAPVRARSADKRRLLLLLVLLPILIATGAGLGGMAGGALARKHRVVNLAERLQLENTGVSRTPPTPRPRFAPAINPLSLWMPRPAPCAVVIRWRRAGVAPGWDWSSALSSSLWRLFAGGRTTRRMKAGVSAVRAATSTVRRNFSGSVCRCPPRPSL